MQRAHTDSPPPASTLNFTLTPAQSKQVKQRLGGNVKLIVSGGAPLAPHVEEFLKVAMCAPVVQVGRCLSCVNDLVIVCIC